MKRIESIQPNKNKKSSAHKKPSALNECGCSLSIENEVTVSISGGDSSKDLLDRHGPYKSACQDTEQTAAQI